MTSARRGLAALIVRLLLFLARLTVAVLAAGGAAAMLIPYAYRVRGYYAVGGEWLVILLAFTLTLTLEHIQYRIEVKRNDRQ